MTGQERFLAVVHGEEPDRVPYIEAGIDFPFVCRLLDIDLAADELFDSGEYQTTPIDLQLAVNDTLHRSNLTYHQPPPIPAHKVPGQDQILFFHDGYLKTWDDFDQLTFPDLASEEVRGPARAFLARRGDHAAILSTRVGFSSTYLGMGMEHFYLTLKDDPKLVTEVFRRYTDWSAQAVYFAHEMGFDAIWTSDDIAGKTGLLWSPQMFDEIFWPYASNFAAAVRDTGLPWIYHSDGNLWKILPQLVELGITGLNPIEPACMEIGEVREAFPELALFGNVDMDLLARGTADQVRATARGLIRKLGPSHRFALSSGNSVASYCKVENVRAMCDAVAEFGGYPIAA